VLAAAASILALKHEVTEAARLQRQECLDRLRRAQTQDGGWGPYADSPPEAFDTAVVLLAVAEMRETAGVNEMIVRGRNFLMSQQQPDGGWPATTRPPGGQSYAQRISTTGWAMIALLSTRE
jgi:squalene cyclase